MFRGNLLLSKGVFVFGLFIFLLIPLNTLFINSVGGDNTPLLSYIAVIIALFFVNTIVAVFMLMYYIYNKRQLYIFILFLAFFCGLFYFIETILTILKPIMSMTSLDNVENNAAIFFFFRQITFSSLILLAVVSEIRGVSMENKYKTAIILLCTIPCILFPVMSHLYSGNSNVLNMTIIEYSQVTHETIWDEKYVLLLVLLWGAVLIASLCVNGVRSEIWNCIHVLAVTAIVYNSLLLFANVHDFSIWYSSRAIEVFSKLFVLSVLIRHVFRALYKSNLMLNKDILTSAFNRKYFFDMLEEARKAPTKHPFCVMILDIDHFKMINDKWGHPVGDRVITAIAEITKSTIRETDVLARIGGEEFAILVCNIDQYKAENMAERIRTAIQQRTSDSEINYAPEKVTVSIGAILVKEEKSLGDIYKQADEALYYAKKMGRNRVEFRACG
ncbi:GGDEF domain-containing protein [Escherichia coli]|uniref:sensor domain-containing diguanylate cyclase n=1 Tax=Escherichia coli TaxID=562 RepID=UPI0006A19F87|nr:sensor domain-containing diguanylate cyclase [Escherichia coli]EES4627845.1 GGDEF domain-containing protein [Escherichia coli]EES4950730.1 GGDEF domain-containing protein [Escherichia coli]KNA39339.1 GGDEF domain-containing protein [Escherichia coli M114]